LIKPLVRHLADLSRLSKYDLLYHPFLSQQSKNQIRSSVINSQRSFLMKILPIALLLSRLGLSSLPAADPTPADVLGEMKRVADWQIAHPSKHRITDWTQAPFFLGLSNLHQVSGDDRYLEALTGFGDQAHWGPGKRLTHADDHAVLQAWLEVHELDGDKARLKPTVAHFPKIIDALKDKPKASVSGGSLTWCWCDALLMSPPVWVHLSEITGDPQYLEWADREWWTCTDVLYDPDACLYYRDNNFFKKRTESGRKVFWSRGNGWVCGGIVHVLDRLPAEHPSRERYLGLYHDMMHALVKLQNADGLWRSSLLDPEGPVGESSGTAFFTYAMAWGLNRGLLPGEPFRPAMMKGWQALCGNIQPDGMLGFVQKIGDRPGAAGPDKTEVYGSGAFLLAGSEIVRLLDPSKRREGLASFEGVKLPSRFLRATPRVFARFVPEREDDFAWENDLIAFRAYGPALRGMGVDSGFDAWLKRVPWPILDKWYIEDVTKLRYGKVAKSYHSDQGEGYDAYKVGESRGCGGISLWIDDKLHPSGTFTAHRIVEHTPERAVIELDYASTLDGKAVRETKRITVLMGQRLFQCESCFTIDGKAGAMDVAIGLKPQTKPAKPVFSPKTGTMLLWETLDGLGLGTGIVIDPASVTKMSTAAGQALCLARTDDTGSIRWFAGYGWEGQGEISSAEEWKTYLEKFAAAK
jgi:unsaturated rhamnogalacturonyl hydrolase